MSKLDVGAPRRPLAKHQRKYLAHLLTLRWPSDSAGRIGVALANAQVDLNPHQVDAALFAFRSPLSKGALLADEVGLGKTIEAGLVIAQRWAERRRRILVVTPASLRKQWQQELSEKFFLPSHVIDSKLAKRFEDSGKGDPFEAPGILIISYEFAKSRAARLQAIPWDLVVFDEAHRLRNVQKSTNVIARTLREVFRDRPKLLLTATPLQNSVSELFGLVSFIDEHIFGDVAPFRDQLLASGDPAAVGDLRRRLGPICHRSLRRQVEQYIRYTRRLPAVQEFTPTPDEQSLYEGVNDYLRRSTLGLPGGSRFLIGMVLRKLLASSSFAITDALRTIARRLRTKAAAFESELLNELAGDYEALSTASEEWQLDPNASTPAEQLLAQAIAEAEELEGLADFAQTISTNAKGDALLEALRAAFERAAALGAPQKAVIFTESRRTQAYLLGLLHANGYADGLLSFDGSNSDPRSRKILESWLSRWRNTDRASGSRSADVRAALVDYFRDEGRIMVATEAAAEGLNLQFCSLVVNYDLPWNPQRVEQRIGRCHRYGQRHDVVVVNLLNRGNAADRRVFQLLADKFRLFEGIFGASDEILGAVESGVDIERRIAEIYENCRTDAEIDDEFNELQAELEETIQASVAQARVQLLENFDDEVREKLRVRERESVEQLDVVESALLDFTYAELGDRVVQRSPHTFELVDAPEGAKGVALGTYALPRRDGAAHVYRLDHPLATHLLGRARKQAFVTETVEYSYSSHRGKITALEPHLGKTGTLSAAQMTVTALDQVEDRLIVVAKADDGTVLEDEIALRMLMLTSSAVQSTANLATRSAYGELLPLIEDRASRVKAAISVRNDEFYQAEAEKLSAWAEDLKAGLEQELKELDRLIREARRQSLAGVSLEAKLTAQRELRVLERQRARKRRELFESQDKVDVQRDELIDRVEKKLTQSIDIDPLFAVRWELT